MEPFQTGVHAALASCIAAVVVLLTRRLARLVGAADLSMVGPALTIAVFWQFIIQEGQPLWADTPKWHSLCWSTLATSLVTVGLAWSTRRLGHPDRLLLAAALIPATIFVLLRTPMAGDRNPAHIAAFLGLGLVPAWAWLANRIRGNAMTAATISACAALTVLSVEGAHFAKLAAIAATVTASLIAIAVVSARIRLPMGPLGAVATLSVIGALAAIGAPYANLMPGWLWILPAIAPLSMAIVELPPLRRSPRLATSLRYALPLAVSLLAIALAIGAQDAATEVDDDGTAGSIYGP
ncbi:MAG: hypothetical protein JNL80_17580 [Phycisphaerae bacterium]|nr:hypothetical protein [Phycisphaerae bacterium]